MYSYLTGSWNEQWLRFLSTLTVADFVCLAQLAIIPLSTEAQSPLLSTPKDSQNLPAWVSLPSSSPLNIFAWIQVRVVPHTVKHRLLLINLQLLPPYLKTSPSTSAMLNTPLPLSAWGPDGTLASQSTNCWKSRISSLLYPMSCHSPFSGNQWTLIFPMGVAHSLFSFYERRRELISPPSHTTSGFNGRLLSDFPVFFLKKNCCHFWNHYEEVTKLENGADTKEDKARLKRWCSGWSTCCTSMMNRIWSPRIHAHAEPWPPAILALGRKRQGVLRQTGYLQNPNGGALSSQRDLASKIQVGGGYLSKMPNVNL